MKWCILWFASLFLVTPSHAERVLLIGDSHTVGTFGRTLDSELRRNSSIQLRTYGSCGSIVSWWYNGTHTPCGYLSINEWGGTDYTVDAATPYIPGILRDFRPQTVLVALGSNYARGYPDSQIRSEVRALVNDIRSVGARCIWIGPPDMRSFRSQLPDVVNSIASEAWNGCSYIDSRNYTHYPDSGGDGLHYESPSDIQYWVSFIVGQARIWSRLIN